MLSAHCVEALRDWMYCLCWQLDILSGVWGGQQEVAYWIEIWLFYVGRSGQTSHNRLLLLRTKAAMMLDWGSSIFDITTVGIVGVAYCCMVLCVALCWCGQCLLTVGGNWLLHTVTPLYVTTWRDAADRPKTFYTLQNARQLHCKHHSDSGQQVSSLPDCTGSVSDFTADKCL